MQVQGLYSKPNKALFFKDWGLGISLPCSMGIDLTLKTQVFLRQLNGYGKMAH